MQRIARRLAGVVALTLVVATAACGGDDDSDAASPPEPSVASAESTPENGNGGSGDDVTALAESGEFEAVLTAAERTTTYVGKVEGSDGYIALVDNGVGEFTVYVCDGKTVGAWATGTLDGASLTASGASGLEVDATVSGSDVTGTVVVPGWGSHEFTATEAAYPAGLWQPEPESASTEGLKVGWIVLDDGSQRGLAITSQKKLEIVEPVDTVAGQGSGASAGTSTGGPVTTLSNECKTLARLFDKGMAAAINNPSGSQLQQAGTKLWKQAESLWSTQGCPGELKWGMGGAS
jgi:hypothetical protein